MYNSQEQERSWECNSPASLGPVPSAIDIWKPRDTLSEKMLITHRRPINQSLEEREVMRSLNSPGLEVVQLDCQVLIEGLMATAQALMLMNLIMSGGNGGNTLF